jgi:hypothetical protein
MLPLGMDVKNIFLGNCFCMQNKAARQFDRSLSCSVTKPRNEGSLYDDWVSSHGGEKQLTFREVGRHVMHPLAESEQTDS